MALTRDSYRGLPHAPQRKVSIPEPKKTKGCKCRQKLKDAVAGRGDLNKQSKERFQEIIDAVMT